MKIADNPAIPVSAVVATKDRAGSLSQTLESLLRQRIIPKELIVVDGSQDMRSEDVIKNWGSRVRSHCVVRWQRANQLGAATQRNQGVRIATQPFTWFFDDDILFEQNCVNRLWDAIQSDEKLGGVNAMIMNQRYQPPGTISRTMFTLLHGRSEKSFAGRVIGPAVNLLPEDRDDLPEVVPVEWMNTTCTIYRREALPAPPFDSVFTGYSLMEDLTLSLRVGRGWKLANARTARIFHDSQAGSHKDNVIEMAKMELVNRHYVMSKVLGRTRILDHFRLFLWEMFQLFVCATGRQSRPQFGAMARGKWQAVRGLRRLKTNAGRG